MAAYYAHSLEDWYWHKGIEPLPTYWRYAEDFCSSEMYDQMMSDFSLAFGCAYPDWEKFYIPTAD